MFKYIFFIIIGFLMTSLILRKNPMFITHYFVLLDVKYLIGNRLTNDREFKDTIRGFLFLIQFILGITMFFYNIYRLYKYYKMR